MRPRRAKNIAGKVDIKVNQRVRENLTIIPYLPLRKLLKV